MSPSDERERLCAHLERTRDLFVDAISGLSEAQWNFRPSEEAWSIGQVAEHVAISEAGVLTRVEAMVQRPPEPARRSEVEGKDRILLERVPVRGHRAHAPASMLPDGRWTTGPQVEEAFLASRRNTLRFLSTTSADLRSHFEVHPAVKLLDAYQWLLMISVHTERHAAQIGEWKSSPGYPHA